MATIATRVVSSTSKAIARPLSSSASCGTLPTTVEVQALALQQLEALGEALLDFAGMDDLVGWLLGQ